MPTQRYALDSNGPKRLEISWSVFWRNITLRLDGAVIGQIPGQKELRAGQQFRLPDGSTLSLQLVTNLYVTELRLLRDGKPLPGSATDPLQKVRTAYGVIFFVAGLNIVLGAVSALFPHALFDQLGVGVFSILFGVLFLVLGLFVRRRSLIALVVAILVLVLDGIAGFYLMAAQGQAPGVGGLFVRIIFVVLMAQGIGALRDLRRQGGAPR